VEEKRVLEGLTPPLFKNLPPLLEKERGIKGVRLINNLFIDTEEVRL
jgi:hypothetical protein